MQRGEKRREDIHVGETEGERHTEQKIGGTLGEGLTETACPAWGLLMCCYNRCQGFTPIYSKSHMCDRQRCAPHPLIRLHQHSDLCA